MWIEQAAEVLDFKTKLGMVILLTDGEETCDDALLNAAIDAAIARKPKGHDFVIGREERPHLARAMSGPGAEAAARV